MGMIFQLAWRNLFRQKRRNLLLGTAMAIGVMLLVLANSFSAGLTDIMMNKVLKWVTGHVTVSFNERGRVMTEVFRDKDRLSFIATDFKEVLIQNDEAIGVFARAIGNGRADNIILIGSTADIAGDPKLQKEMEESFRLVEGRWEDMNDSQFENPVLLSVEKARYLNVKVHDILRVRFRNVFGQDQSARLTVVGTIKTDNLFMGPVTFLSLPRMKRLMGFDEHSTGNINLVLKEPAKNARRIADAIHARLQPGLAMIPGEAGTGGLKRPVLVLGFNSDPGLKAKWAGQLDVVSGRFEDARLNKQALIAEPLAEALAVRVGDRLEVKYSDQWGAPTGRLTLQVGAVFRPNTRWGRDVVLLQDTRFYEAFYDHWPRPLAPDEDRWVPKPDHPATSLLSPEWILLPRTATTEEMEKKYKAMARKQYRSTVVDVRTMYETADSALKLQGVLNLITLAAVLVLFFIILIGVVNTLRMTIRERTREIGTIRAIGMQRTEVRNLFILETLLLAFFASVLGVGLAFLAMGLLSQMPMHMEDNPMGMLLVSGHLYFLPGWASVLGNMFLIMFLAGITALFPARRAARLTPGAALRHTE